MSQSLVFQNTEFSVVDRNGQPWLRAAEISQALGYASADAISKLFNRNKDEFTDSMTAVVEAPTLGVSGNLKTETRIFSLRGAHLLAMLARTKIAKAFRVWLLDLAERETQTVSPAMQSDLHTIVDQISPDGKKKGMIWKRFNRHFKIAKYNQLPSIQFEEAKQYLIDTFLNGEYLPAPEPVTVNAEISQESLDALALRELPKPGRRFITIFGKINGELSPSMYGIPSDAHVMTPKEMISYVNRADGFPASLIPALISSAANRLQQKLIAA